MKNPLLGFNNTFGCFIIIFLSLFVGYSTLSYSKDKKLTIVPKKQRQDSLRCQLPTFSARFTDVTQPNANDGKITIANIRSATRYAYALESEKDKLTFDKATAITPIQKTIEIKNLPNPKGIQKYIIRLFNGSNKCYSDQTVTFEHVNFAEGLDFADVEIIQLASNQQPALNEEVTFTTIVVNKGTIATTGIEVQQVYSPSMAMFYFYTDKGEFDVNKRIWTIGTIAGGQTFTLVTKARITQQGLSFLASYVSKQNEKDKDSNVRNAEGGEDDYAQTCVSVPIKMDKGESFKVTMKGYGGIKWYYKSPSGKFEEIAISSNSQVAKMNTDSSLTIMSSGEYMYSKMRGGCRISSCCPIVVEGCRGPAIAVDSIYCNQKVDSYNIEITLRDSEWNVAESVIKVLGGIGAPAVTQVLNGINKFPLQSSAGYVVARGGNKYSVLNVPAFIPSVSLTSTDITGKCFNYRTVKAPTCGQVMVEMPILEASEMSFKKGDAPTFSAVVADTKTTEVVWFTSEVSKTPVHVGSTFQPEKEGTYYVAAKNKKTSQLSPKTPVILTEIAANEPTKTCSCDMAERLKSLTEAEIMLESTEISVSKMYPNPADEYVTFDYVLSSSVRNAKLNFYTITGTEVASYVLSKDSNKVRVNTTTWDEGLYLFNLSVDGKKVASNRIVVGH
jgi:uncharacterized repeat protein (TIGR01451 family)